MRDAEGSRKLERVADALCQRSPEEGVVIERESARLRRVRRRRQAAERLRSPDLVYGELGGSEQTVVATNPGEFLIGAIANDSLRHLHGAVDEVASYDGTLTPRSGRSRYGFRWRV